MFKSKAIANIPLERLAKHYCNLCSPLRDVRFAVVDVRFAVVDVRFAVVDVRFAVVNIDFVCYVSVLFADKSIIQCGRVVVDDWFSGVFRRGMNK